MYFPSKERLLSLDAMSLKDTIVQWSEGVDLALSGKPKDAIAVWTAMQEPGARIYFNVASMHVLLGSIENAEKVSLQDDLPNSAYS